MKYILKLYYKYFKKLYLIDITNKKGFIKYITKEIKSIIVTYKASDDFDGGSYLVFRLNNQIIAKISPSSLGVRNKVSKRIRLNLFNVPLEAGELTYTLSKPFTKGKGSKIIIELQ